MKHPVVLYNQVKPGTPVKSGYPLHYYIDIMHTPALLWIDIKMQFIYGVSLAAKENKYLFDNLHRVYDYFTEHHLTSGWQGLPVIVPTDWPTVHRYMVVEIDVVYRRDKQ